MTDKITAQELKARLHAAGFVAEIDFEAERVYVVGIAQTALQRLLTHLANDTEFKF